MFINLLIFLLVVAIAFGLFRFGMPYIKSLKQFAQRFLPAVGVLVLVLGVNLLVAHQAKNALQHVATLSPITTLTALQKIEPGQLVTVVAVASPDNPVRGRKTNISLTLMTMACGLPKRSYSI